MGKATGPRTAKGKARSSKNAAKHWIESGRILEQEVEEAAILRKGFIGDFRPESSIEYEMIDDLVLNRLVKRRIDIAFTREFSKARAQKALDELDAHERTAVHYWQRTAMTGERLRRLGSVGPRVRPDLCISALEVVRNRIASEGLQPNRDLLDLNCIFGEMPTEYAALVISSLPSATDENGGEGAAVDGPGREELVRSILEAIDAEIELQRERQKILEEIDTPQFGSEIQEPTAPVLDGLLRYRAANTREFKDLLSSFESIRRLRGRAA